jgi:hypothetical protein
VGFAVLLAKKMQEGTMPKLLWQNKQTIFAGTCTILNFMQGDNYAH